MAYAWGAGLMDVGLPGAARAVGHLMRRGSRRALPPLLGARSGPLPSRTSRGAREAPFRPACPPRRPEASPSRRTSRTWGASVPRTPYPQPRNRPAPACAQPGGILVCRQLHDSSCFGRILNTMAVAAEHGRTYGDDGVCASSGPAHAGAFEARGDNALASGFRWAAADHQPLNAE